MHDAFATIQWEPEEFFEADEKRLIVVVQVPSRTSCSPRSRRVIGVARAETKCRIDPDLGADEGDRVVIASRWHVRGPGAGANLLNPRPAGSG